ncbi:MAG: MarP family serine protease [Candidatus Saccharibacteria bacterium]
MNLLDLLIIVVIIFAIVRGIESGFICQIGSLGGFLLGLILGSWIAPIATKFIINSTNRGLIALIIIFSLALGLGSLGEYLSLKLNQSTIVRKLGPIDAALGAVFGATIMILSSWLMANLLLNLHSTALNKEINTSVIIRKLDSTLPPTPTVISRLSRLFSTNGFPQVFVGLEPTPGAPLPPPSESAIRAAYDRDAASTVKVEGEGCGGIVEGSGFVAASGTIITNAHVVAGIAHPYVLDQAGRHAATVIWFNPDLDVAILHTEGLAGGALPIQDGESSRGTNAAILGYPGGGPLRANAAVVLDEVTATGRNIYDSGVVRRNIYELQGQVVPGNSGGPLTDLSGTVIGLIFAKSQNDDNIGYALTAPEIHAELSKALASNKVVSTGRCAAE